MEGGRPRLGFENLERRRGRLRASSFDYKDSLHPLADSNSNLHRNVLSKNHGVHQPAFNVDRILLDLSNSVAGRIRKPAFTQEFVQTHLIRTLDHLRKVSPSL